MILAYHTVFTAYGFWLPNDPRGSWSDFVRSWELHRFGPATKVTTRASVAGVDHDRTSRRQAKRALKHEPVVLTGIQARAIEANSVALPVNRSEGAIWTGPAFRGLAGFARCPRQRIKRAADRP